MKTVKMGQTIQQNIMKNVCLTLSHYSIHWDALPNETTVTRKNSFSF